MEKNQHKSKVSNWTDNTTYGYEGKPVGDNNVSDAISISALKHLPKSSFAILADPYGAALPTSEPYPILNKFNRITAMQYAGDDNIDGGNVQQYANSTLSKFLKYFDSFRVKFNVNYRYLPITPRTSSDAGIGKALIDEMRKSIAETVSVLKATTFTQMAINNFAIETDLPLGSGTTTNVKVNNVDTPMYTDLTDVLYATAIYYQLVLQNTLGVMNWHNSFRLKQGTAIRDAWNREVPNLNSFFGLMNKKAFLSMLESINLSFEGEYVDKDFMTQMNMLSLIPSRRSNSITDPVLEVQVGFSHPTKFKIWVLDDSGSVIGKTPLFDDAELKKTVLIAGQESEVTFWEACDKLRDYLSLEATKYWARSDYKTGSISGSDGARFNTIKEYFDVITKTFVIFKPKMADFREVLDIMTRTGTVSWSKGFRPSIVKDTDAALFDHMLVNDIYNMIFSGADEIHFDQATQRWRSFSKWNMYNGVPTYDTKSGGAFLAFSFKTAYGSADGNEQVEYLPILFDYTSAGAACAAVSRDGYEALVTISSEKMNDNKVLSRLAPLVSQSNLKIRVATLPYSENSGLTTDHFSVMYKTLCQIFGIAKIQHTSSAAYDYALDPDILAIYQFEISDITNMAITYARANAPFRGTTSSADLLGFRVK